MPKNKKNNDELECYTIEEVSRIVKLSKAACYRWCEDDIIPNIKFTRGTIRVPKEEFDKFWKKKIRIPEGIDFND